MKRVLFVGRCLALLVAVMAYPTSARAPFLTGEVADSDAQVVKLIPLPGSWIQTLDWLAPEGSEVKEGDPIVRLNPGSLISEEETLRTSLEEQRSRDEREEASIRLALLEAETKVMQSESMFRTARIDAEVPKGVVTDLEYDRFQVALTNAKNALDRAQAELADATTRLEEFLPVSEMNIAQLDSQWNRVKEALTRTEIYATRDGLMIWAENPFTRKKIFPGETLPPSTTVATVSGRENLHFTFWVHEADIREVSVGMQLVVIPDALPDISLTATVEQISSQAVSRDDWGSAGYFELKATPSDTLPVNVVTGMTVMGEIEG